MFVLIWIASTTHLLNNMHLICRPLHYYHGPVVQSVVSLTSSLRVISLTVLADSIHNILIFFAEKMWVAFAKATHIFFSKKFQHICVSLDLNFNESLTNDVVSFERLGPYYYVYTRWLLVFQVFVSLLDHASTPDEKLAANEYRYISTLNKKYILENYYITLDLQSNNTMKMTNVTLLLKHVTATK